MRYLKCALHFIASFRLTLKDNMAFLSFCFVLRYLKTQYEQVSCVLARIVSLSTTCWVDLKIELLLFQAFISAQNTSSRTAERSRFNGERVCVFVCSFFALQFV